MQKNKTHVERVKEFMVKAGQATPEMPNIPNPETRLLRARLIMEECLETVEALGIQVLINGYSEEPVSMASLNFKETSTGDIVAVMDGIADINVVANGTAIAYGVNIEPIQDLVDKSNLDKFRGDAHRNEAGKWIKPSDWEAPNIAEEIGSQIVVVAEKNTGGVAFLVQAQEGCCGGKTCVC